MIRRRRARTRVRAALCRRFNISWADYGSLTLGEQAQLVTILEEEHRRRTEQRR